MGSQTGLRQNQVDDKPQPGDGKRYSEEYICGRFEQEVPWVANPMNSEMLMWWYRHEEWLEKHENNRQLKDVKPNYRAEYQERHAARLRNVPAVDAAEG